MTLRPSFQRAVATPPVSMASWRLFLARLIAWSGLLVPVGIVQRRSPDEVVADPFTAVTLVRGLMPFVCLLLVLTLARPTLRPLGQREWLLTAYLVVVVGSTAWSLAPQATLLKAAHLCVAYVLLVVIARQWRDSEQALRQLAAIVYGVVVLALVTAALWPERATGRYNDRLVAIFPALESFVLGMLAAFAVVFVVAGVGPRWLVRRLSLRLLIGLASVVVLLQTGARIPTLLAVFLAAGLLARRGLTGARALPLLAGVVAVIGLVFSPYGNNLRERLLEVPGSAVTLGNRLPLWQLAVEAVADRPLVGYGYFTGHRVGPYAELFYERIDPTQFPYVDGTWPETLLDLGVVGVVVLLAFVSRSLWAGLRASWGGPLMPLRVALALLVVVYSLMDFTVQQVGYPMILVAGLLLMPLNESGRQGPNAVATDTDQRRGETERRPTAPA